jgi:adenine-specific DNA methylase
VTNASLALVDDTPELRKQRGAFFTPDSITRFIAAWAIRSANDRVLEPAAGDAAFMVAAVERILSLGTEATRPPMIDGVELHAPSARQARLHVRQAGGIPVIRETDFFRIPPKAVYDSIIGNPPFIRFQEFAGDARARSREAALRAGVPLSGLASSWAAFTVHSSMFLKMGGRLGLVLPAELLSVNYAAPVRRFLFDRFSNVQLVLFEKQVFRDADADVVLLLAEGYGNGPATHATIRQSRDACDLDELAPGIVWTPQDPAAKWTSSLLDEHSLGPIQHLLDRGQFVSLEHWGDTTLGIVTGNNKFFTLSPQRVKELGVPRRDILPLSPPGSAHLRGLALTKAGLEKLGRLGQSTWLFYPTNLTSKASKAYVESGHRTGVDSAYKCRVRKQWYRVPLVRVADLLLTCMNADTPRLTTNEAGALHLNSVHGVYLGDNHREFGRELLPLASLNSITLLHAEVVGRSYGGGILKIEPKEADAWAMPSPDLIGRKIDQLREIKQNVESLLANGKLGEAVELVDEVLFLRDGQLSDQEIKHVRDARAGMAERRVRRGTGGR